MSDIAPAVTAEAPAAAEAPVTEAPAAAAPVTEAPAAEAPAAEAPAGDVDPFDVEGTDTFDRSYVEKLRNEAAERRTALKPYEEVFGQYDDGSRDLLLGLARDLGGDEATQQAAALRMVDVAKELLGDKFPGAEGAAPEVDPNAPLTRADLEKIEADRQTAAREKADIDGVLAEIKELGYADGSIDRAMLLHAAQHETKGDLQAAHAKVEAHRQSIIDGYVESVRAGAEKFPSLTTSTGGAAPADVTGKAPSTFKEARKALQLRLAAAPGE